MAGWELYKFAKEKNDAGIYFPVWGTCLGFELLAVLSANLYDLRSICDIQNVAMPLIFKPGIQIICYLRQRFYKTKCVSNANSLMFHMILTQ